MSKRELTEFCVTLDVVLLVSEFFFFLKVMFSLSVSVHVEEGDDGVSRHFKRHFASRREWGWCFRVMFTLSVRLSVCLSLCLFLLKKVVVVLFYMRCLLCLSVSIERRR